MKRIVAPILFALAAAAWLPAQTFVTLPAVDDTVKAFAAHGNILYIAGSFQTVGGMTRHGLAAISLTDGSVTDWNPNCTNNNAGAFLSDVTVSADGSTVYFCGNFDKVGATARNYVAAVDSAGVLQSLSATFNDQVVAVRQSNGTLYVVGNFTMVNATTRRGFAGLDSSGTLTGFDPGLAAFTTASYRASAFSPDGTKLYVSLGNTGLNFTDTDGNAAARRGFVSLRLTDGRATDFKLIPKEGMNDSGTFTVAINGSAAYIGGGFDHLDTLAVNHMAGFKGEVYDPVFSSETGEGPDGSVRSLSTDGTAVYVGGAFDNFGATARKGLVAVDPKTGALVSSWDAQLSVKLSNTDAVVFVHGGKVFIGGSNLGAGTTLLGQSIEHYGTLTAVPPPPTPTPTPAPTATPLPTATPKPVKAPTVKISTKTKVTTKAKLDIRGSATGSVTNVTYKVGAKSGTARGKGSWQFTAILKKGSNTITVIAHGPGGNSKPAKLTIKRK